jgi:hypothetical protein
MGRSASQKNHPKLVTKVFSKPEDAAGEATQSYSNAEWMRRKKVLQTSSLLVGKYN